MLDNHLFVVALLVFVVAVCIISIIKDEKEHVVIRFYLKQKGGDPRNHEWHEVSETMYDMATDDEFFKKTNMEK